MASAAVMVLRRPPYNGDRIAKALGRFGFEVNDRPKQNPKPDDLLVLWNRHPTAEYDADRYEMVGAKVLIVENGYFGRNFNGSLWYAISLSQHNGAGLLPVPDADRWKGLGVELKPWRRGGDEIVILATRNMGSRIAREPQGWALRVQAELRRLTRRPVRMRGHPGPQTFQDDRSLENDLENAWAVVTWGSSAALKAIAMGVPAFHGFPKWIGRGAARQYPHDIEDCYRGDREATFSQVAASMWSVEEIDAGVPFRCLLT